MTWPAPYSTATPPSGLTTIHQMVTAWPGSSPLVWSVKEMPLAVRVRVEVPTTVFGSDMRVTLLVDLMAWVAAPARLRGMADSSPRRRTPTSSLRFTNSFLPMEGDRTRKAGVSANRWVPRKPGYQRHFLLWLIGDMQEGR